MPGLFHNGGKTPAFQYSCLDNLGQSGETLSAIVIKEFAHHA